MENDCPPLHYMKLKSQEFDGPLYSSTTFQCPFHKKKIAFPMINAQELKVGFSQNSGWKLEKKKKNQQSGHTIRCSDM